MTYHTKTQESGTLQNSFSSTKNAYEEDFELIFENFVQSFYVPHIRERKRSWHVDERIARQHIFPTFGRCNIACICRAEVETWLLNLCHQGLAASTCNRILAVLKSIFSMAVVYGKLSANNSPCLGVKPLKTLVCQERHLSSGEAGRLMRTLRHYDSPEATVLRLLLLTGARKSEILKARWEHVHLEQRLLVVPLSKSGKPRHILLSDEAARIIRAIPRRDGSPWLFPGRKWNKPISDVYGFWNRIRRELGLSRVRIHDLRHTFASFLVNAGHSLYEVQQLLGHSDPRTTMRYAHLEQTSLIAATQSISTCLRQRGNRGRKTRGSRLFVVPHSRRCIENKEQKRIEQPQNRAQHYIKRHIFGRLIVTIDRRTVNYLL